jgi:hypothetical protein
MAGAGAKPHGLKHEGREDHFKKHELNHMAFAEDGTGPGGNKTPGNYDAGKKFTKAHPLVNPEHKGECTPMSKSTCTGHKLAFAKRVKKEHGFH